MNHEQNDVIIRYYNTVVMRMKTAEEAMRTAPVDSKRYNRADADHTFALGEQAGISHALELVGYRLIIDDEDIAKDIMPNEQEVVG